MSLSRPENLGEWAQHIAQLHGPGLRSKAIAANQIGFVRSLLDDGFSPAEVETIFVLLAKQLVRAGQRPPRAGLYDLSLFASRTPPVPIELPEASSAELPDEDELSEFFAES